MPTGHLCSDAALTSQTAPSTLLPLSESEINTYPTVQSRNLGVIFNPTLPPHTLPDSVHLPHSISGFFGFFFLNYSIIYYFPLSQLRSPSHLGYFNSLSYWSSLLASPHPPAKAPSMPPLCSCTCCSFLPFTLANSYLSFKCPHVTSSRKPFLGPTKL